MLNGPIFYLKIDNTSLFNTTKTKELHIYSHSLCNRAWIPLQVTCTTFQINHIFMAAYTFYQHKDDHFLTKCQTCLSLLAHIINDSMSTLRQRPSFIIRSQWFLHLLNTKCSTSQPKVLHSCGVLACIILLALLLSLNNVAFLCWRYCTVEWYYMPCLSTKGAKL